MKILTELVTDKTNVINLSDRKYITESKKDEIIDIMSPISRKYFSKLYYKKGTWYYLKKDLDYTTYPFSIPEEMIGTYLANILNLPTVKYEIAKTKNNYGIASKNFKTKENLYCTFYDMVDIETNDNIDILKLFVAKDNYEKLLDQILRLLALDTYMIQRDRKNINLQFERNKITKTVMLAPIYDYANCDLSFKNNILIDNFLLTITKQNFKNFVKKYPKYEEYINILLEQNLKQIWEQICTDYNLNQECFICDRVKEYYETKDENQKKYLKQLIKDVHM